VELPRNFHREYDPALSKREREVIAAARSHLEKSEKRSVDAYYQIRRTPEGYSVLVDPVVGYDGDMPQFRFGTDHTVYLRADGSLIRIEGGL